METTHPVQFLAPLILTHKQEREAQKNFPYNLVLGKEEQHLFYLGSNHSTDPKNGQYQMIDEYWEEFLSLPGEKVVLIEGGEWEFIENREESIKRGESSYLKHLAEKTG